MDNISPTLQLVFCLMGGLIVLLCVLLTNYPAIENLLEKILGDEDEKEYFDEQE